GVPSSRFDYQTVGGTHRNSLVYSSDAPFADDVKRYVETIIGDKVIVRTDAQQAMNDAGIIYTSPSQLMTAYPNSYNSIGACKKALQRIPVECPNGWRAVNLLTEGRGQKPSQVFVRPDIDQAKAMELIEKQTGLRVKSLSA
ncbi:MAG: hypothetical protein ABJZ62_04095, partial [Hyphomicrobiales bacterium]